MEFGAFSISLTVKDFDASRAFYEKLGFEVTGGDASQNWLIMANCECIIGLFHGMFDKNVLTFNPGLNNRKERLAQFTDIRELQKQLEVQGVQLTQRCDESSPGPASITLLDLDPDGNPILIDQFLLIDICTPPARLAAMAGVEPARWQRVAAHQRSIGNVTRCWSESSMAARGRATVP